LVRFLLARQKKMNMGTYASQSMDARDKPLRLPAWQMGVSSGFEQQ
jgi:hypothetical protein